MSEMTERVARALSGADEPDGIEWYGQNPRYWTSLARAAIEAMREPSEAMINAAPDLRDVDFYPTDVWRAMVEAALEK